MVVGNGMLARAFKSYQKQDNIIIFASGISYSNETDSSSFVREKEL